MAGLADLRAYSSASQSPAAVSVGGGLPTFHDKPELFGGPFREDGNVRDDAGRIRHQ
jgi:hypothetical protein